MSKKIENKCPDCGSNVAQPLVVRYHCDPDCCGEQGQHVHLRTKCPFCGHTFLDETSQE